MRVAFALIALATIAGGAALVVHCTLADGASHDGPHATDGAELGCERTARVYVVAAASPVTRTGKLVVVVRAIGRASGADSCDGCASLCASALAGRRVSAAEDAAAAAVRARGTSAKHIATEATTHERPAETTITMVSSGRVQVLLRTTKMPTATSGPHARPRVYAAALRAYHLPRWDARGRWREGETPRG